MSSYPKGEKKTSYRQSRPRKRKFYGQGQADATDNENKTDRRESRSASQKKITESISEKVTVSPSLCYRIIEFFSIFSCLSEILICGTCKGNVTFEETGIRGLGFKLVVKCRCGSRKIDSSPLMNTGYEINRKIVFVMRLLGIGNQGLKIFCNFMDIGAGLSENAYNKIYDHIHSATKKVFEFCCKKAVSEEMRENEKLERPLLNFKVSGDGTWKKRGFKSLYGVTTLIAYHTGKVIDVDVKSTYCQSCVYWSNKSKTSDEYLAWQEEHDEETCANTHQGSAGSMEVQSIKSMFLRSEELHGVKYTNYIGDGDSKTFTALLDADPYDGNPVVIKSECVGHVQKRMGTRLRNIKKANKLGGKGKLTDALIKKMSVYYGLAIRRNIDSVDNMKEAILSSYYHMISTDEVPRHEYCPTGADSWCQWQKANAINVPPEVHPAPLHPDVQKAILPIYEDLSREDLLTRCLGGHTQNANESLNSTIWRLVPKHLHCGLKVLEIAVFLAAMTFNEGNATILMVLNELKVKVGFQSFNFAQECDRNRVKRQNRRSSLETEEGRRARRAAMNSINEGYEREEGLVYGPGIAD